MRRIIQSCLLFAALSIHGFAAKVHGPNVQTPSIPEGPKIKVLLEKDVKSAILEAKGPFRVVRRDTHCSLSTGVAKRFPVQAIQNGLRWGEEYPDVYQIALIPRSPKTYFLLNGIQYKGAISIYHVQNNEITIVNEVPVEEYVKSILAIEQDSPVSKEAMSAIAILTRTEAFQRMLANQSPRPWDITKEEARYHGAGITRQKNIDEAVEWTRFMIVEPTSGTCKLSAEKAEALASRGMDAKKILTSLIPNVRLGVTIPPDELALR